MPLEFAIVLVILVESYRVPVTCLTQLTSHKSSSHTVSLLTLVLFNVLSIYNDDPTLGNS